MPTSAGTALYAQCCRNSYLVNTNAHEQQQRSYKARARVHTARCGTPKRASTTTVRTAVLAPNSRCNPIFTSDVTAATYLAMMAWMCRTVWCMLSCALTRLPSCRRIWRVVAGCAASTSGTSAASGAAVASMTAPAATADDLGNGSNDNNGSIGNSGGRQADRQPVSGRQRPATNKTKGGDGSATQRPGCPGRHAAPDALHLRGPKHKADNGSHKKNSKSFCRHARAGGMDKRRWVRGQERGLFWLERQRSMPAWRCEKQEQHKATNRTGVKTKAAKHTDSRTYVGTVLRDR